MLHRPRMDTPDLYEALRLKTLELKTHKTSLRVLAKTEHDQAMIWLNITEVTHATFRDGGETSHAILLMAEPMYEHQAIRVINTKTEEKDK